MTKLNNLRIHAAALCLAFLPSMGAAAIIDFEGVDTMGQVFYTVSNPYILANVDGSGVDVAFSSANTMALQDIEFYTKGVYQDGHVLGSDGGGLGAGGLIIDFSVPVSNVSLDAGDLGGDDDQTITLSVYDAANNLIETSQFFWGISNLPYHNFSLASSDLSRIIMTTNGQFPTSVVVDNIVFTSAVPLPPTLMLLGSGLIALFGTVRKQALREPREPGTDHGFR